MNLAYFPAILVLFLFILLLGTLNINILLKAINWKIEFLELFRYYLLAWSLGLIIPGKFGEISLVYFLKKEELPLGKGLAVTMIDKAITLGTLLFFAIFGFFLFFTPAQAFQIIAIIVFLILVSSPLILSDFGRNFVKKHILRKYEKSFAGFSKTLNYYLRAKKKILVLNTILTVFRQLFMVGVFFLLFLAFDQRVSFIYILLINSVVSIVSLIPITISGLGIRESMNVLLYGMVGVLPDIAAGVSLICLVINYIFAGVSMPFLKGK
jgi:uncharacterized protein (TIRG00374 family)